MKRRTFLEKTGGLLGLSMAGGFPRICAAGRRLPASERIRVAVIGVNGRGNNLLRTFAAKKEVEIAAICDVDS
ncbi:MAG: gfo/Idh/MocA family oxidoreductase, partial [Planctomycetota bacterium]